MILRELGVNQKSAGWIRHGFVMAFYFLLRLTTGGDYFTAIKETVRQAGDTDTNACIVGGLVGAAVGNEGIPQHMAQKVLSFDCSTAE